MPKCVECEELFSADEGRYNKSKEFVCAMCEDTRGGDEEDEDEEDDADGDDLDVKVKACPACKEKSEDFAESGICPECGFEKDE